MQDGAARWKIIWNSRDPEDGSPCKLSKKYGTVYSLHIGEERIVILCGYETVKDALLNHAEEFSGRPIIPLFEAITGGHGIMLSNGENWKAMRRFTLSILRDFGMGKRTIEDKIQEESDFLVKKFKSFKGEPFDITVIINTAVANIIICILLSHRFDYEDPKTLRLVNLIHEAVQIFGSSTAMVSNYMMFIIREALCL
ncbi:cytochrome P450 2F3-like [Gastrophryne carolinensis]